MYPLVTDGYMVYDVSIDRRWIHHCKLSLPKNALVMNVQTPNATMYPSVTDVYIVYDGYIVAIR